MGPERTREPSAAEIREAVRVKYRAAATDPRGHFAYPVGREGALGVGYEARELDALPRDVIDRFVGVGNPFSVRRPGPGDHVLDVGCGAGLDVFVAARLVGESGRVVGLDLTPEMLRWARAACDALGCTTVELVAGTAEALPFANASFDLVISNGVLNLVPDKDAAFTEIRRVLREGGALAAADLVVVEDLPPDVLADLDAWST